MITISRGDRPTTIINIFTVAPEQQQRVVDLLAQAVQSHIRQFPGFVGAALHKGLDGTKVTMYAQWDTADDYTRMRTSPNGSPFLAEALSLSRAEPGFYEVTHTFTAEG